MKKYILGIALLLLTITSCNTNTNSSSISNSNISVSDSSTITETEKIKVKFIQLPFRNYAYNENKEIIGYYFGTDIIAETVFTYDKGYYLTKEKIDWHRKNDNLNYDVPELNGDGYWSFTFFTTILDEETGLSTNFLEECILNEDLAIYFGIYG